MVEVSTIDGVQVIVDRDEGRDAAPKTHALQGEHILFLSVDLTLIIEFVASLFLIFHHLSILGLSLITLHDEVVDHRGTHITEENGEHHTLRITGIHHTNDDCHRTDQETVEKLSCSGAARGNGIGSHKHGTESETTKDEVMPPDHRLTGMLEEQC